MQPEQAGLLL